MRYGYFIKNKLLIGPDINYGFNGTYYRSGEAGPYIRYYLRNKRLSPIAEGGYHYRWIRISAFSSVFTFVRHEVYASAGLAFPGVFNNMFGTEAQFQYAYVFDEFGNSNLQRGFVFRITYHFI